MVPFQFDIIRSSASERPYEHASECQIYQYFVHRVSLAIAQNLPAPRPFSPFSNSSRRRKFLGTFAISATYLDSGCQMAGLLGKMLKDSQ